jgi:hypothetical protein
MPVPAHHIQGVNTIATKKSGTTTIGAKQFKDENTTTRIRKLFQVRYTYSCSSAQKHLTSPILITLKRLMVTA